jgi:protein TonB
MISNKYFINDTEYLTDVFSQVDSFPVYGSADSDLFGFIFDNIKYPSYAKENDITGKVIIRFVVMADGSVAGVEVVRAADPYLAAEALRVVESIPPRWKPGIIGCQKVNTAMSILISFSLK